jgi:CelD/BcsL family acetyltransferase involved in cellulose biosynthesis
VRIRVTTGISEVQALRPLWQEGNSGSNATIFQDFDWTLLALQTFSDQKPIFITAESDSSIAILPLVEHNRALTLAGSPLFDYRDAICAGDSSAFEAALEKLATLKLPFYCEGIRGGEATGRWSRLRPQPWTAAPFVARQMITPEAFAAKHTRSSRALRRLTGQGAQVRRAKATPEDVESIYQEKAKEPAGWGMNVFRDKRCIDFMRTVVTLPNTRCDLFFLEVAGEPIAALVTFFDRDTRRFYTTWMDVAWSRHSPGIALLFEATRLTLEEGLDCDYMTGEQPYKLRFTTESEPLYNIEANVEQLSALKRGTEEPELKAA